MAATWLLCSANLTTRSSLAHHLAAIEELSRKRPDAIGPSDRQHVGLASPSTATVQDVRREWPGNSSSDVGRAVRSEDGRAMWHTVRLPYGVEGPGAFVG